MFDISKRNSSKRQEEEPTVAREEARAGSAAAAAPARVRDAAVIGPTVRMQGDVQAEEDMVIHGSVSGTIKLPAHTLTVGREGRVKATVHAHTLLIDGSVEGDIFAAERVVVRKSGDVKGNILAPRVSLEDGAKFKGSIDMDADKVAAAFETPSAAGNVVSASRWEAAKAKQENAADTAEA